MFKKSLVASVLSVGLWHASAQAVIVTGPQGRNTSAPAGSLAETGFNLQGNFGDFLGTPVSSNWFVTAAHFGIPDNKLTTVDGVVHPVTNRVPVAGTDLVLYQVSVPFNANQVASIYNPATDGALTTADPIFVYGRGTQRGAEIPGRGWNWGPQDAVRSFGTNTIDGFSAVQQANIDAGSPFALGTTFLVADFDNNGDPNQGTLSEGDSGGAVFVQKNGGLKLVGINFSVELFALTASGPAERAAIYNGNGLFRETAPGVFTSVPTDTGTVTQDWFSSYVPASANFINATIPEPASLTLLGGAAAVLLRRRRV
ncbi:MAG TPA: PEP-CTERM sorting domain-containing protein [Tepidisphaeraceae bacterium]|jgi:hypothetical protein